MNKMVRKRLVGRPNTAAEAEELRPAFIARLNASNPDDCWEWQGRICNGYGTVPRGKRGNYFLAHRVSVALEKGGIGTEIVRHTCDNPRCVNPRHLLTGTQRDNNRDTVERGRNVTTGLIHTKLTIEQVREIRASKRSVTDLAREYGVQRATVYSVRMGRSWVGVE